MQYQSLDQLRARCAEELPGFDPVKHDASLRAWVWDALRLIDTDRLGIPATATVRIEKGKGALPADFLGMPTRSGLQQSVIRSEGWGSYYHVLPGGRELRGKPDGEVELYYTALPLDEDGYPYILDSAEMGVLAYVEYMHTKLMQKQRQMTSGYLFRPDESLNQLNRQTALSMLSAVRGELNMLSELEVERLRQWRQNLTTYRNY